MNKLRVLLICGGRSAEHEVSVVSARGIYENLDPHKYEVRVCFITRDGYWVIPKREDVERFKRGEIKTLESQDFLEGKRAKRISTNVLRLIEEVDIVFPVLHGPYGEDGTVQGMLEVLGKPYVGAGVTGSAIGMDKEVAKRLLKERGINVVDWLSFREWEWRRDRKRVLEVIKKRFDFPLFVKPSNLGSSVGITKAKKFDELEEAIEKAFSFDEKILVEFGLDKPREIEVSVLGYENDVIVSIPGEIVPSREFYDYEAKYIDESSLLLIPAPLGEEEKAIFMDLAYKTYFWLELEPMARVDFLMDTNTGKIYVNEVNTIPGFTPISMYPKLLEASGISYSVVLDRLIEYGLKRRQRRDSKKLRWI